MGMSVRGAHAANGTLGKRALVLTMAMGAAGAQLDKMSAMIWNVSVFMCANEQKT